MQLHIYTGHPQPILNERLGHTECCGDAIKRQTALPGLEERVARKQQQKAAQGIANDRAVAAGAARNTLSTIESEDMPLAYLPGNSVRVRVRVVGDVAAS